MLRFASVVAVLMPLGACTLWFDDDDGDNRCDVYAAAEGDGQQDIAPAPLRDPSDLTCDDYGGPYCNPECGPCPLYETTADLAPLPSYGYCGHICETYNQGQCETDPQCRVVLDADCSIGESTCFTNFMGCFPTDNQQDTSVDCWSADAWTCSRSNECTAYHSSAPCGPNEDCSGTGRPFELCAVEGEDPGGCEQAYCDRAPPQCPAGTFPGVRDGCYTDACIPNKFCLLGG
jgi:hypothetical protein